MGELAAVFQAYHYEVCKFVLPDFQPATALFSAVHQFMGDHARDTLLIFYFDGHGGIDDRNEGFWAA